MTVEELAWGDLYYWYIKNLCPQENPTDDNVCGSVLSISIIDRVDKLWRVETR